MAQIKEKCLVAFVGQTQQVTETVKKRILIVTLDYEGEYPTPLKCEAINNKCEMKELDEIRPGDIITVSCNIRGNNWDNPKTGLTEVINSFSLWKIDINITTAGKTPPVYAPPVSGGFAPPAGLGQAPQQQTPPSQQQGQGLAPQQPPATPADQPTGYTADQLPPAGALPF